MDDVLPSYGEATTRDHWSIISSFVRSQDLCAAALVSQEWNQLFMPHLWGNPASHFGKEFDAVYIALVRFKRTLPRARLTTRELTHTLHLPPAQAELYDGPHADWLQDMLEQLPRLQSLVVSQLPFFDHGALMHLDIPRTPTTSAMYQLRLLDASGCINTTPQGLAVALKHFPALIYLDISGTLQARSLQVLSNLWRNPALQILKARGLGLTDSDIQIIAQAVGTNLRSLDVRDNRLTDQCVRTLLARCIKSLADSPLPRHSRPTSPSNDWSAALQLRGGKLLDMYRTQGQDEYIKESLTTGFVRHLGLESASGSGITHVYISGNQITVEGVSGLLRSKRLHVLDAGTILGGPKAIPVKSARSDFYFPGAEKLTPILDSCAEELTYLRLNHSVITKNTPSKQLAEMEDVRFTNCQHITFQRCREIKASEHSLLPSMTPNLQTLVLTDVPQKSLTPTTAQHLIQFITDCSNESHWAVQQSKVGYALPPGRDRRSAERQYAQSLFPLQRIVLEMAPEKFEAINPSRWQTTTYSSVLDPDCETLWNAAKDDFSFFGAEECGQPDADPASFVSLATLTEKMTVVDEDHNRRGGEMYDVLAEVGRFRREKKAEYERAVKRDPGAFVEGYWKGEIVVIRPR
ncbi:hypothetical protein EJ08DRAFT_667071 [Tothia fuscella]|uniref:F-box domain-containing protein n=1 Tax=Tothia fuscella TaxID=1048955 RepID=A0A9P4P449_9PEZI|nr:hypothetical protein EJ08DRAFT_667071 [Tothia fuscella]